MADMVRGRLIFTDGATMKAADLDDESIWTSLTGGTSGDATVKSYYQAVPWLWRGTNLIAQAISALPFALVDKAGKDYDTSDEWQNKVGFLPYPSRVLWLVSSALTLTAQAYLYRLPTKGGGLHSLHYLLPSSITPKYDGEGKLAGFTRRVGAKEIPLKVEEVVYFWTPDPWVEIGPGTAPVTAAMMAAGVLYNKDKFAAKFFERGAIKAMLLKVGAGTAKDERDRLKSWWKRLFSGISNSWNTEVINADVLEPVTIGEGLADLENEVLTSSAREDIATALGVPQTLLFSNAANYATAKEDRLAFYADTVVPDSQMIAEAFNEQVFGPLGLRMEFRPETLDVFQEDENDRAEAFSRYAGVMPASMAAQLLGLELPAGVEYEDLDEMEPGKEPQQSGFGALMQADLDKWRRLAVRRFREGKSLDYDFESEAIPEDWRASIQAALLLASTEEEVKAAFQRRPFQHVDWQDYP